MIVFKIYKTVTQTTRERANTMNKCDDCDSEITLTLEAYGNGQMMKIECPQCGTSYDTNLDPTEQEEASK